MTDANLACSNEVLARLELAKRHTGERFLPACYTEDLRRLRTRQDLAHVHADDSHPLWWFLPPIAFDMLGSHQAAEDLLVLPRATEGLVLIPPPFLSLSDVLEKELCALGFFIRAGTRTFTDTLVGLIYGGYPWFDAYIRLTQDLNLLGDKCGYLLVASSSIDVPHYLLGFKSARRDLCGEEIRREYSDLAYPGLLRPFHTPARIENSRHIRAVALA
jgi:hypothetical protein